MTFLALSSIAVFVFCVGIIFVLPGRPVSGMQVVAQSRISVNEGRPLAKASEMLERTAGVAISYEDPPWIYAGDVVRAADLPWGAEIARTHPNFNAIVPKSGQLEVDLPVERATGRLSVSVTESVHRLLTDHSNRKNAGTFKALALDDGFVIVPVTARDAMGRLVNVRSPLDSPIFFEEAERSALDTLSTLFQAVSKAGEYKVELGVLPNHLAEMKVTLGSRGEIARDVLVRFLSSSQWSDSRNRGIVPKMSWRLLFEPKDKYFIVSFLPVKRQELDPSGRKPTVVVPR